MIKLRFQNLDFPFFFFPALGLAFCWVGALGLVPAAGSSAIGTGAALGLSLLVGKTVKLI